MQEKFFVTGFSGSMKQPLPRSVQRQFFIGAWQFILSLSKGRTLFTVVHNSTRQFIKSLLNNRYFHFRYKSLGFYFFWSLKLLDKLLPDAAAMRIR